MNDERFDHLWYTADLSDSYDETGADRPRVTGVYTEPVEPSFPVWDPAEELAYLLQEAHNKEYGAGVPYPRAEAPVTTVPTGSPPHNLQDDTEERPPLRKGRPDHRKHTMRKRPDVVRVASYVMAVLAAVTVSMVGVFSCMVTYEPLLLVTTAHHAGGASGWWPLLVYGPWTAGSLSVLRAALLQRRAVHSWFVVLLFSSVAVLLCVLQAPRTVAGTAVASLPGIAAVTCFQQLVRQITLTRPPRRSAPRHRQRPDERPAMPVQPPDQYPD
ncbi:hypothetical protein ABZ354_02980 [Streptomyces sp. NPDC005925]|uniref:hypothetical protein n=1 Tax=Streptomyces sp. NPDC005925 TaxID=3157172 RepID=UPI0033CDAAD7